MEGVCDVMDREKLKYALEFSFIGLCRNIFGCSKTRVTIHGNIVIKSNDEELCLLNFDDTVTAGAYVNNISRKLISDELTSYGNTHSQDIDETQNLSKGLKPSSDINAKSSTIVDHNQKFSNSFEVQTEAVKENFVSNKYRGPDHIRCCACKDSDAEDGSWDDDKASVIVDDDVSESFVPGNLCLESLEDDAMPNDEGPMITEIAQYSALLPKVIKSLETDSNVPDKTSINTTNPDPAAQDFGNESKLTFHSSGKLTNSSIMNSMWKKNSRYRHVCLVCGMAFTFRTNLTRHAKKIHGCRPDKLCMDQPNKDVQQS